MESHVRSIVKALTWRVIATFVTVLVAWFILGDVSHALEIGLLDTFIGSDQAASFSETSSFTA